MGLILLAPLFGRWRMASPALVVGASIILALSAFGLTHPDPRFGQAAIESDPSPARSFVNSLANSQVDFLAWLGNQPRPRTLFDRNCDMARFLLALVICAFPDRQIANNLQIRGR